jgi:Uma2 family endonuclease
MQPTQTPVVRMTVEEYLEMERTSEVRHNYVDGYVFPVHGPVAMAGESLSHGRVSSNVHGLFFVQLLGKPCEPFTKDTKVRSGPLGPRNPRATAGMFSYPDVVVVCGKPEFQDDRSEVILNPKVIVEVLSPSTEEFDRVDKFERYERWNSTLTDYLLVRQNRPLVEHYTRQTDGTWVLRRTAELDAVVNIPSVGVSLRLADVYDRVEFPELPDSLFPNGPAETPNS